MYQYPCVCGESTMSFKFDIGGPFTGECCAIAKAVAKTRETIFNMAPFPPAEDLVVEEVVTETKESLSQTEPPEAVAPFVVEAVGKKVETKKSKKGKK